MNKHLFLVGAMLLVAASIATGCGVKPPPPPPVTHSLPELKYLVLGSFEDVFWCDPDLYPIAREGQEEKNAQEQFPVIKANDAEFAAILQQLSLPAKPDYTAEEKLLIYRERKKLTYQIEMALSGNVYQFTLRVKEGQGERIQGTVTSSGTIKVSKREPSINTCPICLAAGTLIDTPNGAIPVEELSEGMPVWTADSRGNRVAGTVLKTSTTPVPSFFKIVRMSLSDGRSVTASPGHPTAEARGLGEYQVGDILDGAAVTEAERIDYNGVAYDLLPSGDTSLYWANGILLKSTLAVK